MLSYRVSSVLLASLVAVSLSVAYAQTTFATITGTVTDTSGLPLPGAAWT